MIKRIWLPIIVGFSAGAIVAGSVLLAVFVARGNDSSTDARSSFNKNDKNNKTAQINEVGGVKLTELVANELTTDDLAFPLQAEPKVTIETINGAQTEVTQLTNIDNPPLDYASPYNTPWKRLQDKIAKRLNNGPEIGLLKGIYFQNGIPNAKEDYGFYIGASNEIYINTASTMQELKTMGVIQDYQLAYTNAAGTTTLRNFTRLNVSYDLFSELMAEQIFQTIYHEYGHHMAYVYLNSDNRNDAISPIALTRRISETKTSTIKWDAAFVESFRNILGYNNIVPPLLDSTASFVFRTQDIFAYAKFNGKRIYPLAKLYSQKALFDKANSRTTVTKVVDGVQQEVEATLTETYPELVNSDGSISRGYLPYATPNSIAALSQAPVTPAELAYYWSAEELYTRKMQQATMPSSFVPSNELGYKSDGYIQVSLQKSRVRSNFLYDTWHYAEGIDQNDNSAPYSPFYQDYLYSKTIKNNLPVFDNSKALALYTSMTTRMGYQSNDDISVIWFENNSDFDPIEGNVTYPKQTWSAKFGGYISAEQQKTIKYVGYFNDIGFFVSKPIVINSFNFNVKDRLNSTTIKPLSDLRDNYFYQTSEYIDLQSEGWFDHDLYFAETASGKNAVQMTTFNRLSSTDVGEWDDRNSYAFARNSVTMYKTKTNGVALYKWIK